MTNLLERGGLALLAATVMSLVLIGGAAPKAYAQEAEAAAAEEAPAEEAAAADAGVRVGSTVSRIVTDPWVARY